MVGICGTMVKDRVERASLPTIAELIRNFVPLLRDEGLRQPAGHPVEAGAALTERQNRIRQYLESAREEDLVALAMDKDLQIMQNIIRSPPISEKIPGRVFEDYLIQAVHVKMGAALSALLSNDVILEKLSEPFFDLLVDYSGRSRQGAEILLNSAVAVRRLSKKQVAGLVKAVREDRGAREVSGENAPELPTGRSPGLDLNFWRLW